MKVLKQQEPLVVRKLSKIDKNPNLIARCTEAFERVRAPEFTLKRSGAPRAIHTLMNSDNIEACFPQVSARTSASGQSDAGEQPETSENAIVASLYLISMICG